MPRLIDRVIDCAVYLYANEADANRGEQSGGSGFLFGVPMGRRDQIYAVSNWHVVKDAPVVRLNTSDGGIEVFSLTTANWYRHPDQETDLAVAPLNFDIPAKYRTAIVGYDQLLTHEMVRRFNVGIGDDLFLVGRFVDHDGVQRNQPTVRFGAISQMPINPINTEIGNQDAFLAEIRSIAGFSGSPVFALIPPYRDTSLPSSEQIEKPKTGIGGMERILLVGIDCGHMYYRSQNLYDEIRDSGGNRRLRQSDQWSDVNTGMAVVVAAWKLDELLNDGELKKMREEENRRRERLTPHTRLDSARRPRVQTTFAPEEKDRIEIPVPSRDDVMDIFKKATQKREKK